jgi:hypothetical protein
MRYPIYYANGSWTLGPRVLISQGGNIITNIGELLDRNLHEWANMTTNGNWASNGTTVAGGYVNSGHGCEYIFLGNVTNQGSGSAPTATLTNLANEQTSGFGAKTLGSVVTGKQGNKYGAGMGPFTSSGADGIDWWYNVTASWTNSGSEIEFTCAGLSWNSTANAGTINDLYAAYPLQAGTLPQSFTTNSQAIFMWYLDSADN